MWCTEGRREERSNIVGRVGEIRAEEGQGMKVILWPRDDRLEIIRRAQGTREHSWRSMAPKE